MKILISLAELHIETNNPREGLNCYIRVVMANPLALHSMRKALCYANHTVVDEFVKMVHRKINEEFLPMDAGPLNNLIEAHNLTRYPKNFKKAYKSFFDLRSAKICKQPLSDDTDESVIVSLPRRLSPTSG